MKITKKSKLKKEYRYLFPIVLSGVGRNADEAWEEAVEMFIQEPGPYEKAEKGEEV